jgi:hypothetical protein
MTVATALAVSWKPLTNSNESASAMARRSRTAVPAEMPNAWSIPESLAGAR